MLDPILSLSFAMHSNRGVYAVLLGSGVSRAASIPSGWEVVLDLIRKLAVAMGENAEPDPETWYEHKFGRSPGYSSILAELAKTPSERQHLLKEYFEPSADDEMTKRPTKAHRAIAEMVRSGHIRVILTTNFDRLMEQSLEALGVNPIVISTTDMIAGALPLVHAPCTVIKLHGDYLDARTKNTPDELASYDDRLNHLLDKIFDEYGLVVCGWSADWDEALRSAVERCKGRRFSTYWAQRGVPSEAATRLIAHRAASVIEVRDADVFFTDLHQKVRSLAAFDSPHPLSAKVAAVTLKRLLSEDRHRIELSDFVSTEVKRVIVEISDAKSAQSGDSIAEATRNRMKFYESHCEVLQEIFVVGCKWANDDQCAPWSNALVRLADVPATLGNGTLGDLLRYPALLMLFAGGLAALASSNFTILKSLLVESRVQDRSDSNRRCSAFFALYPQAVLDSDQGKKALKPADPGYMPLSDHLHDYLRESLRDGLPNDDDYTRTFDRLELLIALLYSDMVAQPGQPALWFPQSSFGSRGSRLQRDHIAAVERIRSELKDGGDATHLLRVGMFKSLEHLNAAIDVVEKGCRSQH